MIASLKMFMEIEKGVGDSAQEISVDDFFRKHTR